MYKAEMINLVDNRMPFLSTNKMCSEDILFSLFPVRAHLRAVPVCLQRTSCEYSPYVCIHK